jgi:uncharacterized Zn-binding protein involved in type VI secretion
MLRVIKLGDITAGHGNHPPTTAIPTARTVFADNLPLVVVGDQFVSHGHPVAAIMGSPTVFVENKPLVREGDLLSCGDVPISNFSTVFSL